MKSKEQKREEALSREAASTYKREEKPCCHCKRYKRPLCKELNWYTPRKHTCALWRAK